MEEMEHNSTSASSRSLLLHRFFVGCDDGASEISERGNRETLLDTFLLLHDELNSDVSKRAIKEASSFTRKYDAVAKQLHDLCLSKNDFDVVRTIGRGQFGEVHVVREKHTSDVYAMKTLRKSDMLAQENTAFFEEERDIMANVHSEWITALHYGFQDSEFLYLVMEYHPGGDLLTLLSKYDEIFEEKVAKFYLSEMAMAIDCLHSSGYVHRDIKPDNVLISASGHIKLADFGSSAHLSLNSRSVTSKMPVGTPDYISPEVLSCINGSGRSYGVKCDWWSFGICGYEMLFGQTPFTDDSIAITYNNIVNHKSTLKFPEVCEEDVSDAAKDLIRNLLCDEDERLDVARIRSHSFFAEINFETLLNTIPPYVPTIKSIDDTSNFEELESKGPDPGRLIEQKMRIEANRGFSGKDLPFVGFTFSRTLSNLGSDELNKINECNAVQKEEVKFESAEQHELQAQVAALHKELEEKSGLLEATRREKNVVEKERALFEADVKELTRRLNREQADWHKSDEKAMKLVDDVRQQNKQLMELKEDEAKAALEEQKQIAIQLEMDLEATMKRCCCLKSELSTSQKNQEKIKSKAAHVYAKYKKLKEESTKSGGQLEAELKELRKGKTESETKILELQSKVVTMTSDLNLAVERRSSTEKLKSKLQKQLSAYQDSSQASSSLLSKEVQQAVNQQQLLEKELHELRDESERKTTSSNFQIKRYKEKLALVEESQKSAEKQLQTLREQAEKVDELKPQLTRKTQECADLWEANKALTAALVDHEKEIRCLRETNVDLKAVLENRKSQLETYMETISVLKERCTALETQVEDLEVAMDGFDEKEENLVKTSESLKSEVDSLTQQLAASKQQHNYEKLARQKAEERVSKAGELLKEAEEAHNEDISNLQEQAAKMRLEIEKLSDQLKEAERAHALSEVNVKCLEDRLEAEDKEQQQQRRQISKLNREIGFIKATNMKLHRELESVRQEIEGVSTERDNVMTQLSALSVSHNDEKIRMETTQAQQAKLISLLQSDSSATKPSWKKKMAATQAGKKMFKRSRDPQTQTKEWKQLQEAVRQNDLQMSEEKPPSEGQALASQTETIGDTNNVISFESMEMISTKKANPAVSSIVLNALQQSPGNQSSPRATLISTNQSLSVAGKQETKPASQMKERMHHNIPHRFSTCRAMRTMKCSLCRSTVHFGKHVAKCTHCKVICHTKCAPSLPATCGLPSALVDHYVTESLKPVELSPSVTSQSCWSACSSRKGKMQGWLKLLRFRYKGMKCGWEQQWAVLSDKSLILQNKEDAENCDGGDREILNLTNATLQSTVACLDLPDAAKTDIPFVFAIHLPQPMHCWPTQIVYCLSNEKQQWIQSLKQILKTAKVNQTCLKFVATLEHSYALDINCCLPFNDNIMLLGAGEGFFVLHTQSMPKSGRMVRKATQSSRALQQMPGIGSVQQMETIPTTDLIVMITGNKGALVSVHMNDIKSSVCGSGSPPPAISFNKVNDSNSCSLFCSGKVDGKIYLLAVLLGKIRLLTYLEDKDKFCLLKDFNCGKHVVGAVSFTGTVFIVTTEKYCILNPKTLHIEDFAASVLSATVSESNFPVTALAVSTVSEAVLSDGSLDILLCFSESGIFVDQHGKRTKQNTLIWSKMPIAFAYRAPHLFISYLNSAEVINLKAQKKRIPLNIEITRPRLLSSSTSVTDNEHLFIGSTSPDQTDIFEYQPSVDNVKMSDLSSASRVMSPKRARPLDCFTPLAVVNGPKHDTRLTHMKEEVGDAACLISSAPVAELSEKLAVNISDVLSDSLMSAASDTPSPKRFRESQMGMS